LQCKTEEEPGYGNVTRRKAARAAERAGEAVGAAEDTAKRGWFGLKVDYAFFLPSFSLTLSLPRFPQRLVEGLNKMLP
jgi:hypothetical protein